MVKSLLANRFKEAAYHRNIYCATLDHGIAPEECSKEQFWAHVANGLKPFDRIEVMPESGEWFLELMVAEVSRASVRTVPMRFHKLARDVAPMAGDNDLIVSWKGPMAKWCVVRKADSALLYRDIPTKDAAEAKLAEHVRPKAAAA